MTEEELEKGNAIKKRIDEVAAVLEQIDGDKISPIVIHAGMASSVQFDIVSLPDCTDVQSLDARVHETIHSLLIGYKASLVKLLKDL